MSERDAYEHGVPCWVDATHPDPEAALDYYRDLFGWSYAGPGRMPGEGSPSYYVAQLEGSDVGGVCSLPPIDGVEPAWNTYISVDSVDATVQAAPSAGGTIAVAPFDTPPAGRMAVLADPAGARFCIWEAGERKGAQRVNEAGAWAMSALSTNEPGPAADFYGELFGWTTEAFGEGDSQVTLWRLPGYEGGEPGQPVSREVVAVMTPLPKPGDAPRWSVDFWVEDVEASVSLTEALGGGTLAGPHPSPTGSSAVLADPQGVSFAISSDPTAGAGG